ncbi:pyruvate/2-oxoglutarate dehydrogenase complex dihydrolipoamide dehydrogenase (E3) component [Hasllibacter halocynthiae]|uniref:Pyruvate/2-oxoglutarate dehydrogenase complex dihydrolipoamide dehydrogenase (E3) component n=1 Tax=Hasllibacter halocynthiae TaxID=595589 RepID=A0A2T0X3M0_9RHOB|nr:FAD-dependent oxidoreductase [Hasllibacter halocynthiae]PRY93530.1 pyruvate/2-oxoglutarate dehydrogenase complex dihydrolipoamide dehydrogenase (E3) component [Hasllibacter halocynthiae]
MNQQAATPRTAIPQRIATDVLVIGAGSGGLSTAAGAVQMGADVVLLEDGLMGGDCLNYGCVPSKALLASAKHAHAMTAGAPFGVEPVEPEVDYARAMGHVEETIRTIAPVDSEERFRGLGVTVIRERGRFTAPDTVQAGPHTITARRIVIATGSSPLVPPIPGLDTVPFLTNETLWKLRERPGRLLIVGGGPIGMEMAQAHRRLGSEVTVIEGGKALGKDDPELAAVVLERLRAEGVGIEEEAKVAEVSGPEGAITVTAEDGRAFEGTHLLIAVGRSANVQDLGLEEGRVEYSPRGIEVGDDLRSVSNRRVYAVGDVAGRLQFTHVAGYHSGVVIRSILFGLPSKARQGHIPWATYTDPELAQVGLTEAEARQKHPGRVEVARFPFDENDRAVAEGATAGLVKVMVVKGRPVGASIVGRDAGNLIGVWALAISAGLKMSQVAGMVAPYPTLGEASKRAAGAYFSPRLFENAAVKRAVRLVQRFRP